MFRIEIDLVFIYAKRNLKSDMTVRKSMNYVITVRTLIKPLQKLRYMYVDVWVSNDTCVYIYVCRYLLMPSTIHMGHG